MRPATPAPGPRREQSAHGRRHRTQLVLAPRASRLGRIVTVGFCAFLGALMVMLAVSFPIAHNWGRWQVQRSAAEVARRAESLPDVVAVRSEVYLTRGEAWGSAGPNYSARNYTARQVEFLHGTPPADLRAEPRHVQHDEYGRQERERELSGPHQHWRGQGLVGVRGLVAGIIRIEHHQRPAGSAAVRGAVLLLIVTERAGRGSASHRSWPAGPRRRHVEGSSSRGRRP